MATGWSRFAYRFGEYYRTVPSHELWMPPRLSHREWMFSRWDGRPPDRHRAFRSMQDLSRRLISDPPHSCFYSTAYYKEPEQRKMDEKGWQGADLIFDLDGDHLPGVTDRDFPGMLDEIQIQAWRLWNDFLEPDFGFKEEHLQLSFSGHRGFHLHYRDPNLWSLDRDARRELVSHITGDGISVEAVLRGGEHGWRKRIEQGVFNVLGRLNKLNQGDESQRKVLKSFIESRKKAPDSQAKRVSNIELDDLAKKAQVTESRKRLMQPQYRRHVFGKRLNNIFWELVRGDSNVILADAGETDESVTVDIKRVIRWITSLHGKSGLRVTEFPLSRLDPDGSNPFDALQETLPFGQGSPQQLELKVDNITARIGDEEISGSTGQTVNANESLAMFLVLKGWAEPISG